MQTSTFWLSLALLRLPREAPGGPRRFTPSTQAGNKSLLCDPPALFTFYLTFSEPKILRGNSSQADAYSHLHVNIVLVILPQHGCGLEACGM